MTGKRFEESKTWFRVSGSDALRFLSGMWTSDVKRAASLNRLYTCAKSYFLSAKGKAYGEFLYLVEEPQKVLFAVKKDWALALKEALEKYIVADDVNIEACEDFSKALVVPNSDFQSKASLCEVPRAVPTALDKIYFGEKFDWGYRLPRALLGEAHDELWLFKDASLSLGPLLSREEYDALRVKAGVPEWGVDMNEESFLLEFPLGEAFSFNKGCYIGQEVIARTTHRGHINRAFVRFHASTSLRLGYIFSEFEEERPVGKITTLSHNSALGALRLSALDKGAESLYQKKSESEKIKIQKVEVLVGDNSFR